MNTTYTPLSPKPGSYAEVYSTMHTVTCTACSETVSTDTITCLGYNYQVFNSNDNGQHLAITTCTIMVALGILNG